MTKPFGPHFLALSAWTWKIAHIINYREAQTIPNCMRYIIGVFCCNLSKLRYSSCSVIYTSHSLSRIADFMLHILLMNTKRTQLHNINFITCSKADRVHDPKNLSLRRISQNNSSVTMVIKLLCL